MKLKFTTFDIKATVLELQQKLIGMRVVNVYDIDSKNYLIKLNRPDQKAVLLLESGIRLHTTEFEWPKNVMPSGFAMKMRKHLKGRRLEKLEQLGVDRIVDLQFGSGEAAYHVILELYDRGNIVLTDFEYMILNIQRPRTDNSQDVKFVVREKYPLDLAKKNEGLLSKERLTEILLTGKQGDVLKKILNPHLVYGGHLIEHCLLSVGMSANVKIGADFNISRDLDLLMEALKKAESIMNEVSTENIKGYIIQQKEKKPVVSPEESEYLLTYSEFHPLLYEQHVKEAYIEFDSFDKAIDEFFSKIESQKQDKKVFQQEKAALKKLDHIKSDHMKRIEGLKEEQETDVQRARLIELNLSLVDQAITVVRSALASQMDWPEIQRLLAEAAVAEGRDSVATSIKSLKLDTNHITMLLKYPFPVASEDSDDEMSSSSDVNLKAMKIDIDLGLSGHANARRFYDMKRHAAVKQMKTIDASEKAFKSAEKKTKQTLKEVHTVATINKARKTHWFEKFLWFISSENYVVIGGRDQQQNEFIVKRYLKPGDIYVHADLHGASSVVIKNPSREPVPPKTLNEAGSMALCNSAAWEAKVVTSSWWVYHDQVSKTAPSGEYLTTGSFMIRGKKNYLPPSYLIYGFGFLFKVDESCLNKHRNERRVRTIEDDEESLVINLKEDPEEQVLADSDDGNKSDDEESSSVQTEEDNSSSRLEHQTIKEEEPGIPLGNDISETEVETVKEDEGITEFPDTTIQLQHIAGNQFQIQRNVSYSSVDSQPSNNEDTTDAISSETEKARGARLSAKQRRELKKKQQKMGVADVSEAVQSDVSEAVQSNVSEAVQSNVSEAVQSNVSEAVQMDVPATVQSDVPPEATDPTDDTTNRSSVQSVESNSKPQQPLKRGQKSKLKKIKDKYGDQDEEERQMRMELLASDRGPNEEKQKKSKKGGNSKQTSKAGQQKGGGGKDATKTTANQPKDVTKPATNQQKAQRGKLTINDIKDTSTITDENAPVQFDKPVVNTDAVADVDDGNEDEEIQEEDPNLLQQDMDLLDSLTGIPENDDILLYCVPVCAPYSTILNYKYKVKLVPGTTRRGKAAKMALNLFMHEKSTSMMEKDLFRSVKDTDLSRNMPGKVKVSSTAKQTKQKQR